MDPQTQLALAKAGAFCAMGISALGSAYGVQILRTMQKDFDVFAAVERGELSKVADWLREYVFSCASVMDPDEWIRHITGESLNPDYYLSYLEEKYSKLYELK